MRSLIVSNASAGGAKDDVVQEVRRLFAALGEAVHVQPASLETFDDDVASAARDKDLVVVAGGDGTLNCALNALRERLDEVTLALVPLGTGNDFARTVGLPHDPAEAAEAIVREGKERSVDYGRARGGGWERLFLNACMGGFPVEVNEAIDEDTKRRLGPLAFWAGGVKAVAHLPRFRVRIGSHQIDDVVAVGIGNGKTAGGGIPVFPAADPADGELECTAMQVSGLLDGLRLAGEIRSGDHVSLENVWNRRAGRIEVEADPVLEFNVDGDLVGLTTPAVFEVAGSIRMRLPDPSTK